MTAPVRGADVFRALHRGGTPLVLFNAWDAGSAKALASSGAKAIATSSWSVAAAHGFNDGERIPLRLALDNLRRIVCATELPVTVDLESGYGDVGETIALAIEAGAVGCNLEDSVPATGDLRAIAEQCARIRAARQSAGATFFINARTDVFLQPGDDPVADAIARSRAYADAGADGIFAPGLEDTERISQLVEGASVPVNVMVGDRTPPLRELAARGVARVSHGPRPYLLAMHALEAAARAALAFSILSVSPCGAQQSLGDAWWTGSVQAAGAATLPAGHVLFEPYVYDVIGDHSQTFTSRTYLIYGLIDRLSVGVIPILGYDAVSGSPSSSRIRFEDLTAQAQYRLTQFHVGSWVPTTSFLVQETFPTGQYDRLGDRPGDGFGAGAYTTTLALYSQTYFWMPNGRILRARLDIQQSVFSTRVPITDASVYGTPDGFRGRATPGPSTFVDLAGEYSMTRRWVLALDINDGWNGDTRAVGDGPPRHTGSSTSIGFTPAVEYNWNAAVGVIVGARVIEIGRNTARTVTPVVAVNLVH